MTVIYFKEKNKGIYLVSETSGFVSPFDKYHIVKGHFMISMLILWNMAPLIRVLILMFTSEFRVAECWIFKIFLMPVILQVLSPTEYLILLFIFLYIFTLCIYLDLVHLGTLDLDLLIWFICFRYIIYINISFSVGKLQVTIILYGLILSM